MTTIRAVKKGANLKIVGGLINAPVYDLYAPAKYKSTKDLKGTTIGVTKYIDLSYLDEARRTAQ